MQVACELTCGFPCFVLSQSSYELLSRRCGVWKGGPHGGEGGRASTNLRVSMLSKSPCELVFPPMWGNGRSTLPRCHPWPQNGPTPHQRDKSFVRNQQQHYFAFVFRREVDPSKCFPWPKNGPPPLQRDKCSLQNQRQHYLSRGGIINGWDG